MVLNSGKVWAQFFPLENICNVQRCFGCLSWGWGMILASGGSQAEMLLNSLQCVGQSPITQLCVVQNINAAEVKKPWSTLQSC